jgi:Rrf2 family protein
VTIYNRALREFAGGLVDDENEVGNVIKLSTKSRYGLRILVQIALESREGRLANGRILAREQEITEAYLEQIMIPLKAAKLVKTRRGCRGGYELDRAPEQITILEVLELFEGGVDLVNCDELDDPCPRRQSCLTRPVWKALSDGLRRTAAGMTVAGLLPTAGTTSAREYVI